MLVSFYRSESMQIELPFLGVIQWWYGQHCCGFFEGWSLCNSMQP